MSGDTYQINPGPPQQLTGAPQSPGLFTNTDTNVVWIGSTPNVSPGNGQRLAPQGTASWTSKNTRVYACVDTGVTQPVTIYFSADFDDVTDPVAQGVAIAAELAVKGVPDTLLVTQVVENVVLQPGTSVPNPGSGPSGLIDVSEFASISVSVFNFTPTQIYSGDITIGLQAENLEPLKQYTLGMLYKQGFLNINTQIAKYVYVYNNAASPFFVSISGSNREGTEDVDGRGNDTAGQAFQWRLGSTVMGAGNTYPLTQLKGLVLAGQGPCYMRLTRTNATTANGTLQFVDWQNVEYNIASFNEITTGNDVYKMIALPPGAKAIQFLCTTAGTTIVSADFIPWYY